MKPLFEKWAEIDLDKVAHNVREIKRHLNKKTLLIAVVKADGYGHGMEEVSQVALENGADWLCVTDPFEGERLRKLGFTVPIFILSPPFLETVDMIVKNDLIQGIDSAEQAEALDLCARREGKIVAIHIKIDTGLGRSGIMPEKIEEFIKSIGKLKNLKLQGVYTHFASPYVEIEYTRAQYKRFKKTIRIIKEQEIPMEMFHCANSAAAMDLPDLQMNAVRVGFSLCNRHVGIEKNSQWNLKDCFVFKTKIKGLRKIGAGEHIGYDNQLITTKEMEIAILPVGYGDGIPTSLANKGYVLIRGKKLPIIGSVCMNQIFIDLTELEEKLSIGEEVVLIGQQKDEVLTYKDIGHEVGAGDAETIIRISQAVPKIYYRGGKMLKIKA